MSNAGQPGDHDSDPDRGVSSDLRPLGELDKQLAHAADAAETLAEGVGPPTPLPNDDPTPINPEEALTAEQVLSEELARLDGLAGTVTTEVGVSSPESDTRTDTPPAPPSVPKISDGQTGGMLDTTGVAAPDRRDAHQAACEPKQAQPPPESPEPDSSPSTTGAARVDPAPANEPEPVTVDDTAERGMADVAEGKSEAAQRAPEAASDGAAGDPVDASTIPAPDPDIAPPQERDHADTTETHGPHADESGPDVAPADTAVVAAGPSEAPDARQPERVEDQSAGRFPVEPAACPDAGSETSQPAPVSSVEDTTRALDDLDAALAAATGGNPPETDSLTEPASAPTDKATADSGASDPTPESNEQDAVPSFMRELMDGTNKPNADTPTCDTPNAAQTPDAVAASAPHVIQAKPGVVGTGMLGVVGSAPQQPARMPSETSEVPIEREGSDGDPNAPKRQVHPSERRALLLARIAPVAFRCLDGLASILDRIDRPLSYVGPRVRQGIGWVALATLGTALVVFLVTLF